MPSKARLPRLRPRLEQAVEPEPILRRGPRTGRPNRRPEGTSLVVKGDETHSTFTCEGARGKEDKAAVASTPWRCRARPGTAGGQQSQGRLRVIRNRARDTPAPRTAPTPSVGAPARGLITNG
ncbi:hypothetical protein EVAR_48381_1 [Eumeta japonica]|uniref:Uncharacterized protein n=1 Tax=Eumeta variegata TaxID=151549 RepID=A0A4C1ZD53_EUMVA|nr:hypothetical protein EVAR_48381_1 [Eumeta japonica]